MQIFKTGERVRALEDYPEWLVKDQEYVVTQGNEDDDSNIIIVESGTKHGEGGFNIDIFEKVSDMTTASTTIETPSVNLGLIDGKYGDLTVTNGVITRKGVVVVQAFGNQLLIDLSARQSKSAAAQSLLDQVSASAIALKLAPRYVEGGLKSFFDPAARWKSFLLTGETFGLDLTDEERQAVKTFAELEARFKTVFTLPEPPKAEYVKGPVPKRITNPLSRVRVSGSNVHRNGYSLPIADVQKLWNDAREFWRSGKANGELSRRRFAGDRFRTPTITRRSVIIGCQTISRYELEALATQQKWEF